MHTVMVIAGGLALLAVCLLAARSFGGSGQASMARGALAFLPLWLVAALVNLWVGVARAGYPLSAEAPIFLLVFGAPALAALAVWRLVGRA